MKFIQHSFLSIFVFLWSFAAAGDTAITYQGQLQLNGEPFEGTIPAADITFELFDDPDAGTQIAGPVNPPDDVLVSEGLFQVGLDFGNVHDGGGWLQVTIEGNELLPRQRITPVPVAINALNVPYGVGGVWVRSGDTIEYSANNQAIRFVPHSNPDNGPTLVMGHEANGSNAGGATIAGGGNTSNPNTANFAGYSSIGGGWDNAATGFGGTIGGGTGNEADHQATVGGGGSNTATGFRSTVGGGFANSALQDYGIVSGGRNNTAWDHNTVVGGGWFNRAGSNDGDPESGQFATVSGGNDNVASAQESTVSGGKKNEATANKTTIGGGVSNTASVLAATVGGGEQNEASGTAATIAGGAGNEATGNYSFIPGGFNNLAQGNYSMAVGRRARALDDGSFVWNPMSDAFESTGENQFLIRAPGGVGIGTNDPRRELHIRQLTSTSASSGITLQRAEPDTDHWGLYVSNDSNLGFVYNNSTVARIDNDGNYSQLSDERFKHDIEPLDDVLDTVLSLQPTSYVVDRGDGGSNRRSFGFIAQQVASQQPSLVRRFDDGDKPYLGLNYNEFTVLNTQALIELNQRYSGIISKQGEQIASLKAQLDRQRRETAERLAALEALLDAEALTVQASR